MTQLGFIGLGIMGKPMASHLVTAGHTVHVYDINSTPVKELAAMGAVVCHSSKEVAQQSDIIFTMLPDTPDVESALFGQNGIVEGIKQGAIVVDMSSISPAATKEFASRLNAQGIKMLDAPVSGGQIGAEKAILSIMVGGDCEVLDKVKPYFEIMGKKIIHIGSNGDGQTCKIANQIVVALNIEAVSEALLFASKAGADLKKVREALLGSFAQSKILETHGQRILERNFSPGFRIKLHQKDLDLALQGARSLGISLPNTSVTQELFNAVAAQGGHEMDHSALVLALETLANHQLKI
jgi:2-hydroxy-3-oxopropionate reductase